MIVKFCDPLYGYIELDKTETYIIEHAYFQRLKQIKQLGFVQHAYPSALSHRFSHCIGACYLGGLAFDSIIQKKDLDISPQKIKELRKYVRLATLLHDIGHGPLSHVSESFMPALKDLKLDFAWFKPKNKNRKACHEDYTVKIITDSDLTKRIKEAGCDPVALASLLHPEVQAPADIFTEKGLNYLFLLKQIVSSDLDVDRMDYIHRDSYFCGVRYGIVDWKWILSNMTHHLEGKDVYLAIQQQALWTVESFLLGRHHMHLAVYFHSKAIIFEETLRRYIKDTGYILPSSVEGFTACIDDTLMMKIKEDEDKNEWASRILKRNVYRRFYEYTYFLEEENSKEKTIFNQLVQTLQNKKIPFILAESKNHSLKPPAKLRSQIFLKDGVTGESKPLSEGLLLFKGKERQVNRQINRIYLPDDKMDQVSISKFEK